MCLFESAPKDKLPLIIGFTILNFSMLIFLSLTISLMLKPRNANWLTEIEASILLPSLIWVEISLISKALFSMEIEFVDSNMPFSNKLTFTEEVLITKSSDFISWILLKWVICTIPELKSNSLILTSNLFFSNKWILPFDIFISVISILPISTFFFFEFLFDFRIISKSIIGLTISRPIFICLPWEIFCNETPEISIAAMLVVKLADPFVLCSLICMPSNETIPWFSSKFSFSRFSFKPDFFSIIFDFPNEIKILL